jgi:hypothetical protein
LRNILSAPGPRSMVRIFGPCAKYVSQLGSAWKFGREIRGIFRPRTERGHCADKKGEPP